MIHKANNLHTWHSEHLPLGFALVVVAAFGVTVAATQAKWSPADARAAPNTAAKGFVSLDKLGRLNHNVFYKLGCGWVADQVSTGRNFTIGGHLIVIPPLSLAKSPSPIHEELRVEPRTRYDSLSHLETKGKVRQRKVA